MKKLVSTMFYDSLTAIIFAAIAGTIGMVVDGILIGYCLGEGSMAAFGIASPVFLVLYALGGVLSSGMQAKCAEIYVFLCTYITISRRFRKNCLSAQ